MQPELNAGFLRENNFVRAAFGPAGGLIHHQIIGVDANPTINLKPKPRLQTKPRTVFKLGLGQTNVRKIHAELCVNRPVESKDAAALEPEKGFLG